MLISPGLPGQEGHPKPEFVEMSENDRETKKQKEDALKESRAGNDAHKKKEFDAAIKHYSKAMELDDEDILYIIDRSAVYFDLGKYNECIGDCNRALERGQNLNSDVQLMAKAWTRKGLAYVELVKCAQDYDLAIEALDMAYKMHENQDTLHKLDHTRRAKEELEQKDRSSADKERESGNMYYNKKQFEEAVKHYTEAIKLNPSDPRAYSNRAVCYIELERLADGLKDADKCLELDPKFVKGYLRKGNIECKMQEYIKALDTYETGIRHAQDNEELRMRLYSDMKECLAEMPSPRMQANAMSDPEIKSILSDPIMRQVLIDFQQNSSDAQEHAMNSQVLEKLQKLSAAGLI